MLLLGWDCNADSIYGIAILKEDLKRQLGSRVEKIESARNLFESVQSILNKPEVEEHPDTLEALKLLQKDILEKFLTSVDSFKSFVFDLIDGKCVKTLNLLHNFMSFLEIIESPITSIGYFTGHVNYKILTLQYERANNYPHRSLDIDNSEIELLLAMGEKIKRATEKIVGNYYESIFWGV